MQSNATIVYLDTPDEIVVKRLEEKLGATGIGRIVGIKEHGSLEAVLKYRRQFYERWADVVFTPTATHSPEATTREFILWRQSHSLIPQMRRVG